MIADYSVSPIGFEMFRNFFHSLFCLVHIEFVEGAVLAAEKTVVIFEIFYQLTLEQ